MAHGQNSGEGTSFLKLGGVRVYLKVSIEFPLVSIAKGSLVHRLMGRLAAILIKSPVFGTAAFV